MVGLKTGRGDKVAQKNASKRSEAFKHVFPQKGRDASPLAAGDLERALGKVHNEAAANRLSSSPVVGGKSSFQVWSLQRQSQLWVPEGGQLTLPLSNGESGALSHA